MPRRGRTKPQNGTVKRRLRKNAFQLSVDPIITVRDVEQQRSRRPLPRWQQPPPNGTVLRRLLYRHGLRRHRPGFHSRFGGLWTDRLDAKSKLAARLASGEVSQASVDLVRHWIEFGYVILKNAVPHDVVDTINAEVDRIWEDCDPHYRIELGAVYHDLDPKLRSQHYKLLDLHAQFQPALQAAFAPRVTEFLQLVFEATPLLFQSLTFETGSSQPVHQDTAYVVVTRPMEFAASWIALEDIQPGSGELVYYPGSHRLPEHRFRAGYKNWNAERDGEDSHREFLTGLHQKAKAEGQTLQSFRPKKGDALIWSADLAHGGGPITDPSLTRRSLVSHYCPASARPYYFGYKAKHRRVGKGPAGGEYSSSYYRI